MIATLIIAGLLAFVACIANDAAHDREFENQPSGGS